jgi:uncharacterized membrane protein
MEIIGIILLIFAGITLTYIINKYIIDCWNAALFCSVFIIAVIMLATALLSVDKFYKEGVKEYLQHPETYTIKIVYEDSIPVDTIVELK